MAIELPALSLLHRAVANEAKYGAALCALALRQAGAEFENRRVSKPSRNDLLAFIRNPFLRQIYALGATAESVVSAAVVGSVWGKYAGQAWPDWVVQPDAHIKPLSSMRHARIEFRRCPIVVIWSQDGMGLDARARARISQFDPNQFDDFIATCRCALALLEALPSEFSEVMAQGVTIVPIITSEKAHESFSTWDMPGVVFLGFTSDAGHLAEAILHEVCHHVLNGISRFEPLALSDEPKFVSPWRPDPRPAAGVLHGIFVFANVASLQLERIRNDGDSDRRLHRRHQQTVKKLRSALDTLPLGVLAPLGKEVFELCQSHVQKIGWSAD